jgi:spermidine synthase
MITDALTDSLERVARQLDPPSVFPNLVDVVQPGQRGNVVIDHVTVTQTRLWVDGVMVMSDSDFERGTNREVVWRAKGNVLIAGLGLGFVLRPILSKPSVMRVTVIEKNPDVIALVGPTLPQDKLDIVEADIFQWNPPPGTKYDVIYFDIWPTLTVKNLSDMAHLHHAFTRYRAPGGWIGSWCYAEVKARRHWPIEDKADA